MFESENLLLYELNKIIWIADKTRHFQTIPNVL